MNNLSSVAKKIIAFLAVVNIAAMMAFEYGLPSLATPVIAQQYSESEATQSQEGSDYKDLQGDTGDEGTIDAIEKEQAKREEEAAENALAKAEAEDADENEVEEERDPDAPILELTDDHIYLRVGDRFNYMSYIKTMEDVDGSDLSHYIYLDRDVDTSEPGEIELTYRITSTITGKSSSKVLLITIRE